MRSLLCILILCVPFWSQQACSAEHNAFFNGVLRYESDSEHPTLNDRERLRYIASAGMTSSWNNTWETHVRLRTGVKDRQNSAAHTVYRITDQSLGQRDVFIDRAYMVGRFDNITLSAGKIPWLSEQITDIFWDRDLNPMGVTFDITLAPTHQLHLAYLQPLDGSSATVGHLSLAQWQARYQWRDVEFGLMPWYVNYSGDTATYAVNDTHLDNQFIRLSSYVKWGQWRLGADIGKSTKGQAHFPSNDFQDQNASYAVELRHGQLKEPKAILTQFRAFHVERYGVISEFAQDGTARFATSNLRGWEVRLRRQMTENWWLGVRYTDATTIIGPQEAGKRLRLEAQFRF